MFYMKQKIELYKKYIFNVYLLCTVKSMDENQYKLKNRRKCKLSLYSAQCSSSNLHVALLIKHSELLL